MGLFGTCMLDINIYYWFVIIREDINFCDFFISGICGFKSSTKHLFPIGLYVDGKDTKSNIFKNTCCSLYFISDFLMFLSRKSKDPPIIVMIKSKKISSNILWSHHDRDKDDIVLPKVSDLSFFVYDIPLLTYECHSILCIFLFCTD